ncbi:MAG: acyl carrier protein [Proteobacteria bacterium]|nr:acyl carrier protein [Pseudomonadota bacterium]MCK4488399.1 acyl carrier protein [Desulfobacterales bacterium]
MTNHHVQTWSEDEIFNALKDILPQVAPLKVNGPVYPATSLAEDLDFDSFDTVEMLVEINKRFSIEIDFEEWILQESERDGKSYTLESLCQCIMETMNKG